MKLNDRIGKVEIPNITDIIKSSKNLKGKTDNLQINDVNVHFFYSNGAFKTTVKGVKSHIAGIPIVYIEYPNKLAYLILDDSLIYDVSLKCFELIVKENYTHTVIIKDLKGIDIKDKLKTLMEDLTLIIPFSPDLFKSEEIKVNIPLSNGTKEQIKLLPSYLSSLGRAKLLENTTVKNNDGLIIVGLIGFLVGSLITAILTVIIMSG